MKKPLFALLATSLLAAQLSSEGLPKDETYNPDDYKAKTKASLLVENRLIKPGEPFWVAVKLKMAEGWHTYWENPGESGMATKIEWSLSNGFETGPILWPTPLKFESKPVINYGYSGEVLLLTQITPPKVLKANDRALLRAKVSWLECLDICLPGKATVSKEVRVSTIAAVLDPKMSELFTAWRAKLPLENNGWKVRAVRYQRKIRVTAVPPKEMRAETYDVSFIPGKTGLISDSYEQTSKKSAGVYRIDLRAPSQAEEEPAAMPGLLILSQGQGEELKRFAIRVDIPLRKVSPQGWALDYISGLFK